MAVYKKFILTCYDVCALLWYDVLQVFQEIEWSGTKSKIIDQTCEHFKHFQVSSWDSDIYGLTMSGQHLKIVLKLQYLFQLLMVSMSSFLLLSAGAEDKG